MRGNGDRARTREGIGKARRSRRAFAKRTSPSTLTTGIADHADRGWPHPTTTVLLVMSHTFLPMSSGGIKRL